MSVIDSIMSRIRSAKEVEEKYDSKQVDFVKSARKEALRAFDDDCMDDENYSMAARRYSDRKFDAMNEAEEIGLMTSDEFDELFAAVDVIYSESYAVA